MEIEIIDSNTIRLGENIFKGESIQGVLEVAIPINYLMSLHFLDIPSNVRILTDVSNLLPRDVQEEFTYNIPCSTDIQISRNGISYTFDIVRRYYSNIVSADFFTDVITRIASMLGFEILRKRSDVHYILVELFFNARLQDSVLDIVEKRILCLLKLAYRFNKHLRENIESYINEFLRSTFC
ncbi:MAG: hypothetical protein NDP13_02310 [Crenarchaeota archaeon]|nr:hypothetical protein [Thermoproteota archaeon]MCR8453804.1 hypothetical protein [Thermoproteota archaeon]MCR8455645.1 hypothetical protein [Thermoproteota archaeon]MCR8462878.1 hypothetical protein [Thermoproteota archaeon]MCR8472848.1 hypothetical protein [Thermoproteota archaeon]